MRIIIEFNEQFDTSKEQLKRLFQRDVIGERIMKAIDNEVGLKVVNWKGDEVYTILIDRGDEDDD